jgi:hypothetical protein
MNNRTARTATATQIRYAARARLNAGASVHDAIVGAIRECGPLRATRVSSAQARGAAKRYAYWGAVRYVIALATDGSGRLVSVPRERASSDRRSIRLAEADAAALAASEDRIDGIAVTPAAIATALGLAARV